MIIWINGNWEMVENLHDVSKIIRKYYNCELADKLDNLISEVEDYDELEVKLSELEDELRDKENEISELEDELAEKDNDICDLKDEIEELESRIEELEYA